MKFKFIQKWKHAFTDIMLSLKLRFWQWFAHPFTFTRNFGHLWEDDTTLCEKLMG